MDMRNGCLFDGQTSCKRSFLPLAVVMPVHLMLAKRRVCDFLVFCVCLRGAQVEAFNARACPDEDISPCNVPGTVRMGFPQINWQALYGEKQ